jgi:acyl carrier protein
MTPPLAPFASREAFATALRNFINEDLPRLHKKMRAAPNVSDDTLLFASGIIDSMAILHLIGFIERATGEGIPPEKVVMKHFESVNAIAASFWKPTSVAAQPPAKP